MFLTMYICMYSSVGNDVDLLNSTRDKSTLCYFFVLLSTKIPFKNQNQVLGQDYTIIPTIPGLQKGPKL